MTRQLSLIACALLAMLASPVAAQQTTTNAGSVVAPRMVTWNGKEVPLRENLISLNPLGVVFEYFSGEFEHAISRSTSVAVTGSYASPFDFTYTSIDLIGRYYPGEAGLRGFSVGPTVGYTHVSEDFNCFGCGINNTSDHALTLGVEMDYSWILGPSQHFGVELGLGAKHLFFSSGNQRDASTALPTARVSIGYAF